jgi:predicted enzyme related to lactoylglutathione lyase
VIRFVVDIDVPDLVRAVDFYVAAFEFTLARTLFDGTVAELAGGPCPVFLLANDAGSPAAAALRVRRDYAPHWTPVHLDILADALDPALARAVAAGATHEGAVTSHAWGRLALLRDPFGNGVCLIEPSAAFYDAVTDA